MDTKTLVSMEQFLEMPEEKSCYYELWQGELEYVGETIFDHNWVREKLLVCITNFVMSLRLGGDALVETGIRFDPTTLLRPDLSYWDGAHLARIDRRRSPVDVRPQLVVEIASPSNSLSRLFRNARYFLASGVQLVWIVDLDPLQFHVFEQAQEPSVLGPGDKLDGGTVLPGFSEDVSRFVPPAQ